MSDDRKLAGLGGHYQVSGARDGKVATFFNYHPGGNVDRRTNLYYVQTEDLGASWTTVDGRPLAVPLRDVDNPALVVDYAAQGIRVNAICPGIIETPMMGRFSGGTPEGRARVIEQEPGGRMGTPEEIASAVLWLSSDMGAFATGLSMVVDGGQTVGI